MTWLCGQTAEVIVYLYTLDLLITVLNYQKERENAVFGDRM